MPPRDKETGGRVGTLHLYSRNLASRTAFDLRRESNPKRNIMDLSGRVTRIRVASRVSNNSRVEGERGSLVNYGKILDVFPSMRTEFEFDARKKERKNRNKGGLFSSPRCLVRGKEWRQRKEQSWNKRRDEVKHSSKQGSGAKRAERGRQGNDGEGERWKPKSSTGSCATSNRCPSNKRSTSLANRLFLLPALTFLPFSFLSPSLSLLSFPLFPRLARDSW